MEMDYDYQRFVQLVTMLMEASWYDPDELEIGVDISDQPEIKIIFDGYGDKEIENEDGSYEYVEGGNTDMENFAIFLHKDSLTENFVFPEHDVYAFTFGRMIQHRPAEEVCLYVWHDVTDNSWEVIQLEDRLNEDNSMTAEDVMVILEGLYLKYFD